MASNETSKTDLADAEKLWKSADILRGQIDAAEYKHVVLGLLFLKYISDSFEARRDELKGELSVEGISGPQLESLLETRYEYTAEWVFWVPLKARWQNLQNQAAQPDIANLIDDAILAVERDNPNLKDNLPRDYARRGIAPEKMKGLIDLIADIGFKGDRAKARDTLGRVYETVNTDESVVMPNHFHGIVVIGGGRGGDNDVVADLRVCPTTEGAHAGAPLPEIVQWFKTMTTNQYIRGVKIGGWPPFFGRLWQRNYYEHVIRNEESLDCMSTENSE